MPAASGYLAMFYQIRRAYHFVDHALVGRSPCMKELRRRLWNNVFTHNIETAIGFSLPLTVLAGRMLERN